MAERPAWRQQLQLWLILGITGVVLAAGFLLLPRDEAGKSRLLGMLGTSNHGQLLVPVVPMAELPLTTPAGAAENWSTEPPRWWVVVLAAMPCAAQCRDALYVTRQVHVRLGRNADRVERLLVVAGDRLDPEVAQLIEREHPHLRVLFAGDRLAQWRGAKQMSWTDGEPRVFVVDPQGAAMLYFTPAHDGEDLLADLSHLLKYSPEPKS